MKVELDPESTSKLEDILEQLHTMYDLEYLTPEDLIDALLSIGVDMVVEGEPGISITKDRLINYCGKKVDVYRE